MRSQQRANTHESRMKVGISPMSGIELLPLPKNCALPWSKLGMGIPQI